MVRGSGFKIATIFGIPIYLHSSWFIVFALITYSLATGFASANENWTQAQQWTMGLLASLLFFSSVLFHEMSHSVVAKHYCIPVKSITLFVFGGVAGIAQEPKRAWHEFLIAIAGPLSSGFLAGCFFLMQRVSPEGSIAYEIGSWLGPTNAVLAIFNLIPGFPLDGGRIFRSIVWGATGSYARATRIAARSGEAFGLLMMAVGIASALLGRRAGMGMGTFEGLWTAFIGWFLLSMARQSRAQVLTQDVLASLTASDVMMADAPTVTRDISLDEYSREVARSKSRIHLVVADGQLSGLMSIEALKSVPQAEWTGTSIQAVMLPRDKLHWVTPDTTALAVMERMRRDNLPQIAVVANDHVVGLVTIESVAQAMQIRADLERGKS